MRRFMIFMAALLLANAAFSQDLLVKRNGEQMRVKVLKITKKKVQFVRHGTELPVYTLPVSDIEYIEYPMGDRDTFGREVKGQVATPKEEIPKWHGAVPPVEVEQVTKHEGREKQNEQKEPQKWHGAVPPHNGVSDVIVTPKNKHSYAIGDIYNKDGVVGIVINLIGDGSHGTIMSLDEVCLAWSTLNRKQMKKFATGANDKFDGEKNMAAIEKYIADNNFAWSNFPAFEWCRAKGKGWYLPSINELWSAGTMYLGGSRTASNRRFRKNFNINLESAGGVPLSNIMIYYSSTEDKDSKFAQYSHMNSEPPYIQSCYKADELFVRAFYKF